MHWFHTIYSLAAVFMIIDVFWRIAVIPIALASLVFNETVQKYFILIAMFIPYYLMASYSVLVAVGIGNGEKETTTLIVGGLFFVFSGLMGIGQAQNNAEKEGDYQAYKDARVKYIILLFGVIFYIYAIFHVKLTINWLTLWLYHVMQWIQNIPVIGFLVAIAAFVYAVYIIFIVLFMLVGMLVEAFRGKQLSQ